MDKTGFIPTKPSKVLIPRNRLKCSYQAQKLMKEAQRSRTKSSTEGISRLGVRYPMSPAEGPRTEPSPQAAFRASPLVKTRHRRVQSAKAAPRRIIEGTNFVNGDGGSTPSAPLRISVRRPHSSVGHSLPTPSGGGLDLRVMQQSLGFSEPATPAFFQRPPARSFFSESEEDQDFIIEDIEARHHGIIQDWCSSYIQENQSFESTVLFAELKLKEALRAADQSKGPVRLHAAICADILVRLSSVFGRYKDLMELITQELLRCIYADYDNFLFPHVENKSKQLDAALFYKARPYFEAAKRHKNDLEKHHSTVEEHTQTLEMLKYALDTSRLTLRNAIFLTWREQARQNKRIQKKFEKTKVRTIFLAWRNMIRNGKRAWSIALQKKIFGLWSRFARNSVEDKIDASRRVGQSVIIKSINEHYLTVDEKIRALEGSRTSHDSGDDGQRRKWKGAKGAVSAHHALETEGKVRHVRGRMGTLNKTVSTRETQTPTEWLRHESIENMKKNNLKAQEERRKHKSSLVPSRRASLHDSPAKHPRVDSAAPPLPLNEAEILITDLYAEWIEYSKNARNGPAPLDKFLPEFLIRRLQVKSLADKYHQGLLKVCHLRRTVPRLHHFRLVYGLDEGYCPKMGSFFFNILQQIFPNEEELRCSFRSKGRTVERSWVLQALPRVFCCLKHNDPENYSKVQQKILDRRIELKHTETAKNIPMITVDLALVDVMQYLEWEQAAEAQKWLQDKAGWVIIRLFRYRQRKLKDKPKKTHRLRDAFVRWDIKNHGRNASGHLTYNQFCGLLTSILNEEVTGTLSMRLFIQWNERTNELADQNPLLCKRESDIRRASSAGYMTGRRMEHQPSFKKQRTSFMNMEFGANDAKLAIASEEMRGQQHARNAFAEVMYMNNIFCVNYNDDYYSDQKNLPTQISASNEL